MLDKTRKLRQPRFLATQFFNTTHKASIRLNVRNGIGRSPSITQPEVLFNLSFKFELNSDKCLKNAQNFSF